jgi:Tfp pilus assembly protein PilV
LKSSPAPGKQAGFSVEEMIAMLNAGVSIGALLDMIGYSLSHEALEFTHRR